MNTQTIEGVVYAQEHEREFGLCDGCVAANDGPLCRALGKCQPEWGVPGRIWVVKKTAPSRAARHVDEALAELLAERDALKKRVAEVESHSAHIAGLYGRQIQEIALLRTFYARQDATSWEAVRQFDAKGPG